MTVEWIDPIYDRTYADVLSVEENPILVNSKGCYNAVDLNRLENNTKYVMEDMLERKIIKVPPALAIKVNWNNSDIPSREDMVRIVGNIKLLMNLSNEVVKDDFQIIYESTQFTYNLANALEYNLEIMKNQPELPVKKWLLKIINGIVSGTGNSQEYLEEEQVVNIKGIPYGEDAQYMVFDHWSGNTDDLQYVGNVNSQETTFQMSFHEDENYLIELTANFKTRFPRTLTLHGGTIYDEIGGNTRQFFAGDEILILADRAASGKKFYEWLGTEEGLENLTGGPEPSTSWLTMPDTDVELTSKYINAGQHSVTVDGVLQGWYDYNDYVTIFPSPRGDKYTFSYWSGDTGYLEEVTSSSFKMPDVNVRFTSNWSYNYSYNTVNMIKGTINGASKGENLREGSGQSITADPAPEGYVFGRWVLEGLGSFVDIEKSSTTFYIGDGNAVITATYVKSHTVTIENKDNQGETITQTVGEGKKYSISSSEVLTEKMFDYWNKNGERYGSSYYYNDLVMGTEDITYTAIYRDRQSYILTINNGSGSGTYKERQSVLIETDISKYTTKFVKWSGNYYQITNQYSASTSIVMPSENCVVTANYEELYNVTVNEGAGSGSYYNGQTVTCTGNQAPETWEFSHWTEGEEIISYANPYRFTMGTSDREITAHYKAIPYFEVTVINGKLADGNTTGTFLRNSNPTIIMDPAPEGMKFLQWEIIEGDQNDVYQPLAENTYIRNLTHNVTVKATYYVPNPEVQYTLTITDKKGDIQTSNHSVGDQVNIYADNPDEGYKFYKWTGDVQYLIDRYAEKTVVNMPAKNITLQMEYRREDFVTTYHVELHGGELLVETLEDGTERWSNEGEFEERAEVRIRAIDIPVGWKFNGWKNEEDGGKSVSTVNDIMAAETFLTVEDFLIDLTRDVIERDKYKLEITDGEVSGSYHEGDPVSVYSNLENTETTHYDFIRWSGSDLAYIKLFDGNSFDIFKSGTGDNPQVIRMPNRNIAITANYDITYRLKLVNGTVDDKTEEFYAAGSQLEIIADEPEEGKRFSHWIGNVEYLNNKYNPRPIVTMPNGGVELTAIYTTKNNQNDLTLNSSELYNQTSIAAQDLELVSGDLEIGCMVIDTKGHIYTITNISEKLPTNIKIEGTSYVVKELPPEVNLDTHYCLFNGNYGVSIIYYNGDNFGKFVLENKYMLKTLDKNGNKITGGQVKLRDYNESAQVWEAQRNWGDVTGGVDIISACSDNVYNGNNVIIYEPTPNDILYNILRLTQKQGGNTDGE